MAYKLALTMPDRFSAITALIANLPDTNNIDCPERHIPIPVLIVNGTEDKVNPYQGGEVIIGNNLSLGPSALQTVAFIIGRCWQDIETNLKRNCYPIRIQTMAKR